MCKMGHEDRQELEMLLKELRIVIPLKDFKATINLAAGKVKKMSVSRMAEDIKGTDGT